MVHVQGHTHRDKRTNTTLAEQLACPDGATHIAQSPASVSFTDLWFYYGLEPTAFLELIS